MDESGLTRVSVVVVDDHEPFRAAARSLLESGCFDIVGEAATGAEALELLRRSAPDLVLLDVRLPDVSGIEVARRLRADGSTVHIVLVSSQASADVAAQIGPGVPVAFVAKQDLSASRLRTLLESA